MTKGSAVEQLYREVKAELTSRTHLPGQRIDVADLCERYAVSPTPMRNVLNRLVGESIVETHSHDGFYIPRITESSLRDMLAWSEHLLVLAIDAASDTTPRTSLPEPNDDVVVETETIFREMARLNPNGEIDLAVASLNDRLRSLRRLPDARPIEQRHGGSRPPGGMGWRKHAGASPPGSEVPRRTTIGSDANHRPGLHGARGVTPWSIAAVPGLRGHDPGAVIFRKSRRR